MIKEKHDKPLKILFFGLGSIGKRHARLLKNNYDFEVYAFRTMKGQEENDLAIQELFTLKDAFSIKPDVAFITNPTSQHISTALECTKRNIALFIEKPLSNSLRNMTTLEKEIRNKKIFTYVAYNMRFHPVLVNLKTLISTKQKPFYFRVICSSYLPNWRPKQDYSKSYSAQKRLGGGVALDLSHEFDYINWLFNGIKNITGYCDKISDLKIDSEDILDAQITCGSGISGQLHLDYFSHLNERKIQIYFPDEYIEGDLLKDTITILKNNSEIKKITFQNNPNDMYIQQLEYFFKQYTHNNIELMNNFPEALQLFKKMMTFKDKYCRI